MRLGGERASERALPLRGGCNNVPGRPCVYMGRPVYIYGVSYMEGWAHVVKFAMATNWSSFAGGLVQLEECEMTVHLPVQNPA